LTSSVLLKFADDKRVRGDMITTYRIMTGKDKVDPGLFFDMVADDEGLRTRRGTGVFNIRGSNNRLDIRRNSFSQRVVDTWNSLPDSQGVGTVLAFKNPGRDSGVKTVTQNESPSVMLMDVTIGTVCKITHLGEGNVKVVAQSEHMIKVLKEVVTLEENDFKDDNY
jgi:hypothetical protein